MKITLPTLSLFGAVMLAGAVSSSPAQAEEENLANIQSSGITWNISGSYAGAELSVGGATSVYKLFEGGETPAFQALDDSGNLLPDGYYSYRLVMTPQAVADDKATLEAAREAGNEDEVERLSNQLQEGPGYDYYKESGDFKIVNGLIEPYDVELEQAEAQAAQEAAEAAETAQGDEEA
ncbi:MAG: hypothetical protein ABFS39_19785 [Pseudomonadota bacterium]